MAYINKTNLLFVGGYHLFLAIVLPLYITTLGLPSPKVIFATLLVLFISGMGITMGYHRLWSHRSYKAKRPLHYILMFCATLANEGSCLQWCHDHRLHHNHVDTKKDPYNIKKGFWYAHMLWFFLRPNDIDKAIVPDLVKDKLVMFQHKNYGIIMFLCNAVVFLVSGMLLHDYIAAFIFVWWVRQFLIHHLSWSINSLAHSVGTKPYSHAHTAVNNFFVGFLTFGEGYHNFHHTFQNDYRNGVRWYEYDPSKWVVWILERFGLTYDLRRVDAHAIKRAKMVEDTKRVRSVLANMVTEKRSAWDDRIEALSKRIMAQMYRFSELKKKYEEQRRGKEKKHLRQRLKLLDKDIRVSYRSWNKLCTVVFAYV